MPDCPDWMTRTSRRVRVDTRTGRVGYVIEESDSEVHLRSLLSNYEWKAAIKDTRPATPYEVAAALMDE